MIVKRLEGLGYTAQPDDAWLIDFCKLKAENHILNTCNIISVPDGLTEIMVDMVCGEFLFCKKQAGQLGDSFVLETAVKSVQQGDTNVTFDGSQSPESRLDSLLAHLRQGHMGDLLCYRKIRW